MSHFILAVCLRQSPHLFWSKFPVGNYMNVAEWADIYGIHHWQILWSSYRKLAWVGFKPATTEFCPDPLTDWALRPRVQLALRANFVQLLQFNCLYTIYKYIIYIYIIYYIYITYIIYIYIYINFVCLYLKISNYNLFKKTFFNSKQVIFQFVQKHS